MSQAGAVATLRYIRDDGSVLDFTVSWPDPHGAMLAANVALPDGDPRKITRKEVETVRHEAQRIASEWEPNEPAYEDAVILFALAAKLDAILPPE